MIVVSIHAPMQGATIQSLSFAANCQFQSTPLCKGRLSLRCLRPENPGFNPRPYARGDLRLILHVGCLKFQSTPLCKGRHPDVKGPFDERVSIHAPMQGATEAIEAYRQLREFQSTPLCKGRLRWSYIRYERLCFNPRPYARGDKEAKHV